MHCGDVLIYGRNNITDPLPDYYERPLQEAVNICIENERVDAEGRSLAGSAYGGITTFAPRTFAPRLLRRDLCAGRLLRRDLCAATYAPGDFCAGRLMRRDICAAII